MKYDIEFTMFNNPTVRSAPLLAPLPTQRNMKLPRVMKWYTKEQLDILLDYEWYGLKETRFDEIYKLNNNIAKANNQRHKFTEDEDLFIKNNYQYIPDSVIALALNIPTRKVLARRHYLGLKKLQPADDTPFIIVWDKRSIYEKDLAKNGLTLLREGLR